MFFSSRRRHTRYWRDWSSDVCSSDLFCALHKIAPITESFPISRVNDALEHLRGGKARYRIVLAVGDLAGGQTGGQRSEERCVGEECRCRGSSCPSKKQSTETRVSHSM